MLGVVMCWCGEGRGNTHGPSVFQSQNLVNKRALLIRGAQKGPRVIIQYGDIAFNRFRDESSLGHASQLDVS